MEAEEIRRIWSFWANEQPHRKRFVTTFYLEYLKFHPRAPSFGQTVDAILDGDRARQGR